jgi:hypothetical protein
MIDRPLIGVPTFQGLRVAGQPQLGGHVQASPHWQLAPQQHPPETGGAFAWHEQLGLAQCWQGHLSSFLVMSLSP